MTQRKCASHCGTKIGQDVVPPCHYCHLTVGQTWNCEDLVKEKEPIVSESSWNSHAWFHFGP